MKKFVVTLLMSIMVLGLVACGNGNSNSNENGGGKKQEAEKKTATPQEIEAAIAKALGDGYLCTEDTPESEFAMGVLGRIDMTKIESYVCKQSAIASVDLDSVVVVKCKEAAYAEEVVNAFNDNYAQLVNYVSMYPFGVAKVKGAKIYKQDEVVVFVLAGASYDGEDLEAEAKLADEEYAKVANAMKEVWGYEPENLAVEPEVVDVNYDMEGDNN